jgi:hypothetical protein
MKNCPISPAVFPHVCQDRFVVFRHAVGKARPEALSNTHGTRVASLPRRRPQPCNTRIARFSTPRNMTAVVTANRKRIVCDYSPRTFWTCLLWIGGSRLRAMFCDAHRSLTYQGAVSEDRAEAQPASNTSQISLHVSEQQLTANFPLG